MISFYVSKDNYYIMLLRHNNVFDKITHIYMVQNKM